MEAPVEAGLTAAQTLDESSAADSEDSTAIVVERVVESEVVKSESDKQAEDAATAKELTSTATAGESKGQEGAPGSPGGPGIGGGVLAPELHTEVVEQTLAPSPRPAPVVPEPVMEPAPTETPSVKSDPDDGLSLPLRELELAVSALVAALALVTLWMVRRSRRSI
jgi:hypothetical protein